MKKYDMIYTPTNELCRVVRDWGVSDLDVRIEFMDGCQCSRKANGLKQTKYYTVVERIPSPTIFDGEFKVGDLVRIKEDFMSLPDERIIERPEVMSRHAGTEGRITDHSNNDHFCVGSWYYHRNWMTFISRPAEGGNVS